MHPKVYLYREQDEYFELYLGGFSTLDGLKAIDPNLKVELIEIGATSYKRYGFATEKEFPNWERVQELISFMEAEGEFGLIHFEIEIIGLGYLSTHDDGECHFRFKDRRDLINVVKVVASNYQDQLVAALLDNPNSYIVIKESGQLSKYHSFDSYLKETNY